METLEVFKHFLPHSPLTERVVGFLEKLIIEGALKPRERLIESELSRALGISRPPIREALRALEKEELVTFSHRRGVRVTEINEKDVQDVYLIRATLEGLAVKLATKKLVKENLLKLEAIYKQMSQAARKRDLSGYFRFNQEFHKKILESAGNEKLTKILQNLGKQTLRFRFFALSTPGRLEQSQKNHRQLLDALKARDAERASDLRFENVQSGGQTLKTQISDRMILNSL